LTASSATISCFFEREKRQREKGPRGVRIKKRRGDLNILPINEHHDGRKEGLKNRSAGQ